MFASLNSDSIIVGSGQTAAQSRADSNRRGLSHAVTRRLTDAETAALVAFESGALRLHPAILGLTTPDRAVGVS